MNYTEEQDGEVEALESIYPTEFKLLQKNPYIFSVWIKSVDYSDGENGLCTVLKFKIPSNYPDVPPQIKILSHLEKDEVDEDDGVEENLEEEHVQDLKNFLIQIADDNLGMAMVFTLVSEAQEWLSSRYERELKEKEEDEERRVREAEEAERARFEGTRVNVENFMEWKRMFDAEIALKRQSVIEKEKELIGNKLTGRELFMKDNTLNESDLQFLEEGDEVAVEIDESLFDDIDDLDINEESDDDE